MKGRLAVVLVSAAMASVGGLAAAGVAHAAPVPGVAAGTGAVASQDLLVDAGGAGDRFFTGGEVAGHDGQIGHPNWPGGVTHPLPVEVWQTYRYLESSYAIPGLTPGASYEVRLYFLEWYWTKVGQRVFDVRINGAAALSNFDIIKAAADLGGDGVRLGVEKTFAVTADASGTISIELVRGAVDQPVVNAIAVVPAA